MIRKLLFPTFAFVALAAVSAATPKTVVADAGYACLPTTCRPMAYWHCLEWEGCHDQFCGHSGCGPATE